MQQAQTVKPAILNVDKARKSLSEQEAFYLLNHHILLNGKNGTIGKGTPGLANYQYCEIQQPGGENYSVGSYYSVLTNELYSWIYNSNGVHYIQRISPNGCHVVYDDDCLELSADPKHAISQWRAYLKVEKVCPNRGGKYLIWTNGEHEIGAIDVEASIATDSFSTPFFDKCAQRCFYSRLCVPDICGCIQGEFVPITQAEASLSNYIVDKPFQFMVKHVYYDGRESEWSSMSSVYYQTKDNCLSGSLHLSRCIKLRIPIGNPMVDKIKIAFTDDGINWYVTETFEKYKKYNSSQEKWYERQFAEMLNYSDVDCSFDYIFCNDKQRIAVPPSEVSRVFNPHPRQAQGLIAMKDTLGFYNYKQGECPVDKTEIEKIEVKTHCDDAVVCKQEFATVTVRAIIHPVGIDVYHDDVFENPVFLPAPNAFLFRLNGTTMNDPDDPADTVYFGNSQPGQNLNTWPLRLGYKQEFSSTRGFIAYIAGTDYWGVMKQWRADAKFVNRHEYGIVSNYSDVHTRKTIYNESTTGSTGKFFYQEYVFKVPKGTKGFIRLASQTAPNGLSDSQRTSTQIVGILPDIRQYEGQSQVLALGFDPKGRELYFDTCDGDVEFFEAFVIMNYTSSFDIITVEGMRAVSGYVKDKSNNPIEGAILDGFTGPHFPQQPIYTDHNGFYSVANPENNTFVGYLNAEKDCSSFHKIQEIEFSSLEGLMATKDVTIDSENFRDDFYAKGIIHVKDCHGGPIAGLRVSGSGLPTSTTNADGIAEFRIRNSYTRDRVVKLVAMNNAGCFTKDCENNCSPCMPEDEKNMPGCFMGVPTVEFSPLIINADSIVSDLRGLKSGGRYPFGVVVKGQCGRLSAVYPLRYIDIPRTQEKNGLSFCRFEFVVSPDAVFPSWATCLEVVRGENMNGFVMQWVVDKITPMTGGRKKITIQSLNDYNERFFFNTNTTYQWQKGDRVEFIFNGDGSVFNAEDGILNFLTVSPFHDELVSGLTEAKADYFNQLIIEDDGRLDVLKEGAIIEIQRPKQNTAEITYGEMCVSIPISNGRVLYNYGIFETFDTYVVNRVSNNFLGFFEHHSPSDFWGERISDLGKRHVVNQYETERRFGRNIILNGGTVFNEFDLARVKKFDAPEHGDITAMWIVDERIILAIGEHDNFLSQAANDLLRVGSDGIIRAALPDQIISDAEPKLRGAYGCQYDSIGSVFFGDGYARWVDLNKGADVKHDYVEAKDISESKAAVYFKRRSQDMRSHNTTQSDFLNHYRFTTGYDKVKKAIILTTKTLRQSGFNNAKEMFELPNDTILYHPQAEEYLTFASYTGESYGTLNLFDKEGCAFVSYLNGVPFIHPEFGDKHLEYYGVSVDWILGPVLNKFPDKMKRGLAVEVQSQTMWFSPLITTERPGFRSEIPPIKWKGSFGEKWNAAFLSNLNSREGLFGRQQPTDYAISVLLVRDNTDGLKYGTIDNSKRHAYSEIDQIIFKFNIAEQAGFTANL